MKTFKIVLLVSALSIIAANQSVLAANKAKSQEKTAESVNTMVSMVPYYSDNGEYAVLLLKESDNKLHTAAMPKKEGSESSKYKGMLLQWIGQTFTPDKKALTAMQENDKSFTSDDGTTVYLVKVNKTDVNDSGAQWISESDLHAKAKAGSLSSDAKEVYLSKEWNDILNASRSIKKASTKSKKSKKRVHA